MGFHLKKIIRVTVNVFIIFKKIKHLLLYRTESVRLAGIYGFQVSKMLKEDLLYKDKEHSTAIEVKIAENDSDTKAVIEFASIRCAVPERDKSVKIHFRRRGRTDNRINFR